MRIGMLGDSIVQLETAWALIASGLSQEVLFVDCLHPSKWGYNVVAEYCAPRL